MRVTLDLFELDKFIKAGDVDMLTIELKILIPTFIGLSSYRSKYAIECVNFLTKSEILLPEKESVRLKLQAFVNVNGDKGENKAADMQQEIHIKSVKSTLRSLGAGKSDINILSILHYLGSPLGYCTLIFDLMRNLYIFIIPLLKYAYNRIYVCIIKINVPRAHEVKNQRVIVKRNTLKVIRSQSRMRHHS